MKARIILTVRRGVVQRVKSSHPGISVEVVDLDAMDLESPDSPSLDRSESLIDELWDCGGNDDARDP